MDARFQAGWVLACACGAAAGVACAADPVKDYPLRPVRLISPFAAGGNTDMLGRVMAPRLTERLGQTFIVENRPGAGSAVGTGHVAKATPDGHTLLVASGAFTSVAAVSKNLTYDPVRDFAWVSMLITYPFAVVVKNDSALRSVGDLIASAKKHPGKLNYGSVGTGSVFHLAAELFNVMAGVETVHVPYRGGSEPITELIGGRIDVIFNTLTGVFPYVQSGQVRAIAVASLKRSPQLPAVPAVAETLPGYEVTSFAGIAAPRGTPGPVVARLNKTIHAVLAEPEVSRRFVESGGDPAPGTPDAMGRHVVAEIEKWRRIVATRKIDAQQ